MTNVATSESKSSESPVPKFAFLTWIFVIITIQWILSPPFYPLVSVIVGYEQVIQAHGQEVLLKVFSARSVFQ